MRVVVTGSTGRLGRLVMATLLARGDDAVGLDVRPGPRTIEADLVDSGAVFSVLSGADAVIHLGAIPAPGGVPDARVFSNNTIGTFNVFDAAAKLGIRRVVFASSLSTYGYPFQRVWSEPDYFPIDEAHPLRPQDPYGLSKQAGEQIAEAYVRAGSGTAVSLRFSYLLSADTIPKWLAILENNPRGAASSFWSHAHDSDVASACVRAVSADVEGHQPILLTAPTTMSDTPTDTLLDQWFPEVPRRDHLTDPHWSLVDCSLASRLLAWAPTL